MLKVTPFLTFKDHAGEAIQFYVSLFPQNSKVNYINYDSPVDIQNRKVTFASFDLDGQPFLAMDGGVPFSFAIGFSFFVSCDTQAEIDDLWTKLTDGGTPGQCGWLTDKFGMSWQIVPSILGQLMSDKDPAKVQRVREAFLKMTKFDINGLMAAYNNQPAAPAQTPQS